MTSARTAAQYIIRKCNQLQIQITNLKLQKLLYYVQGYSYAQRNAAMFDDSIEAWQHGPVVPAVYRAYCANGALPLFNDKVNDPLLSQVDCEIIDRVIAEKADMDVWKLVEDTYREPPWDFTFHIFGDRIEIPLLLMEKYFGSKT